MLKIVILFFVLLMSAVNNSWAQVANPNHLEPLSPPDDYDRFVFSKLVGKDAPALCMIYLPSFHPEEALILRSEPMQTSRGYSTAHENARQWVLESAVAGKPIWHVKEHPAGYSGRFELDLRKDVEVKRNVA